MAVGYWNEVARFTQTGLVIATDIRGGFGMNGGHCKPAESIPRNAYKMKFMAGHLGCDLRQVGVTIRCTVRQVGVTIRCTVRQVGADRSPGV